MFENEPIPDSQDKLIERLGDCDVPVDYMDLLSHRIRCHKIEIFHYDDEVSFTPRDEEEGEQGLSYGDDQFSVDRSDDIDRLLRLVKDLDCQIRRIELMQLLLKERQQQRAERVESGVTEASTEQLEKVKEAKAAKQLVLSCQEQLEVRNLQHDQHRLQCEINEMITNYRLLRSVLHTLRGQMCAGHRECRHLDATMKNLQQWSEQVAGELPICKHRYQTILKTKVSKTEADRVIKANTAKAHRRARNFLSVRRMQFDLQEFHAEIDELLEYASDLRKEMQRRFGNVETQTETQTHRDDDREQVIEAGGDHLHHL
ncbi:uncharacterized protein LOC117577888 [Drosophila albomicans]|uniref:Uncharacterized protein LOC117577888 n=1 Tax=Drosophila albomicans TaxID=7291 RepID=A0A6P8ZFU4_DROAB|nr:uncharacterized protein LOC117577888 [Drosophila albomicans]